MAVVASQEGHKCSKPTPFTSMDHSYWRSKLPRGFSFYIDRLARGIIRVMPTNGPEFAAVLMEELLFRRNAELANLPQVSLLDKLKGKVQKRGFGGPVEPIGSEYGVGSIPGGKCGGCGGCRCHTEGGGCSHLSRCACNKYLLGPWRPPGEIAEEQASSQASCIMCTSCAGVQEPGGRGDNCICDTDGFQTVAEDSQGAADCNCGQPAQGSSTPWPTPCPCGAGENYTAQLPPPVTLRVERRACYDTCVQCNFGTDIGVQCCNLTPAPSPFSPYSPITVIEPSSYTSSKTAQAPPPPPQPTCQCSSTANLIRPQPVRQICVAPAESPVCLCPEALQPDQAKTLSQDMGSCTHASCADKSIITDPSVEISRRTQTQPFLPPMPYFPMSMMPGQCCMQRGMQMPPIPPWCLTPGPGHQQSFQPYPMDMRSGMPQRQPPYTPDRRSPICVQSPYEQYPQYVPPNVDMPPAPKAVTFPKTCSCSPNSCLCKNKMKSPQNDDNPFEVRLQQLIEISCGEQEQLSIHSPQKTTMSNADDPGRKSPSPSSGKCSTCKPYFKEGSRDQSPSNLLDPTGRPGRPSPQLTPGTSTPEPGKLCSCRKSQDGSRCPTPEPPRSGTLSPQPPSASDKGCGCRKRQDGSRSPSPASPRSGAVSPGSSPEPGKRRQDGSRSPTPEPRSTRVCKCKKRGQEKEKVFEEYNTTFNAMIGGGGSEFRDVLCTSLAQSSARLRGLLESIDRSFSSVEFPGTPPPSPEPFRSQLFYIDSQANMFQTPENSMSGILGPSQNSLSESSPTRLEGRGWDPFLLSSVPAGYQVRNNSFCSLLSSSSRTASFTPNPAAVMEYLKVAFPDSQICPHGVWMPQKPTSISNTLCCACIADMLQHHAQENQLQLEDADQALNMFASSSIDSLHFMSIHDYMAIVADTRAFAVDALEFATLPHFDSAAAIDAPMAMHPFCRCNYKLFHNYRQENTCNFPAGPFRTEGIPSAFQSFKEANQYSKIENSEFPASKAVIEDNAKVKSQTEEKPLCFSCLFDQQISRQDTKASSANAKAFTTNAVQASIYSANKNIPQSFPADSKLPTQEGETLVQDHRFPCQEKRTKVHDSRFPCQREKREVQDPTRCPCQRAEIQDYSRFLSQGGKTEDLTEPKKESGSKDTVHCQEIKEDFGKVYDTSVKRASKDCRCTTLDIQAEPLNKTSDKESKKSKRVDAIATEARSTIPQSVECHYKTCGGRATGKKERRGGANPQGVESHCSTCVGRGAGKDERRGGANPQVVESHCSTCGGRGAGKDERRGGANPQVVESHCSTCGGQVLGTEPASGDHGVRTKDRGWRRDVPDDEVEKFCNACISSAVLSVGNPSVTDCRDSGEPLRKAPPAAKPNFGANSIEVSCVCGERYSVPRMGDGVAKRNFVNVRPAPQNSCKEKCRCGDAGYKSTQEFRCLCETCIQEANDEMSAFNPHRKPRSGRLRSDAYTRTDIFGNRLPDMMEETQCPLQRADCACRGKPYERSVSPYTVVSDLPDNRSSCQSPAAKQHAVTNVEDKLDPINVNVCVQVESVFDSNVFLSEVKKHINNAIDEVKVSQIQALCQMQCIENMVKEVPRALEYPPFPPFPTLPPCKCADMPLPPPPPPSRDPSHFACACSGTQTPESRWQKDATTSTSIACAATRPTPPPIEPEVMICGQDDIRSVSCECGNPTCLHVQMAPPALSPPPPPPPPPRPPPQPEVMVRWQDEVKCKQLDSCDCGNPVCLHGPQTPSPPPDDDARFIPLNYCDCGNPSCLHGPPLRPEAIQRTVPSYNASHLVPSSSPFLREPSPTTSASTGGPTYSEDCSAVSSPAPFGDPSMVHVISLFPRRASEEEINMADWGHELNINTKTTKQTTIFGLRYSTKKQGMQQSLYFCDISGLSVGIIHVNSTLAPADIYLVWNKYENAKFELCPNLSAYGYFLSQCSATAVLDTTTEPTNCSIVNTLCENDNALTHKSGYIKTMAQFVTKRVLPAQDVSLQLVKRFEYCFCEIATLSGLLKVDTKALVECVGDVQSKGCRWNQCIYFTYLKCVLSDVSEKHCFANMRCRGKNNFIVAPPDRFDNRCYVRELSGWALSVEGLCCKDNMYDATIREKRLNIAGIETNRILDYSHSCNIKPEDDSDSETRCTCNVDARDNSFYTRNATAAPDLLTALPNTSLNAASAGLVGSRLGFDCNLEGCVHKTFSKVNDLHSTMCDARPGDAHKTRKHEEPVQGCVALTLGGRQIHLPLAGFMQTFDYDPKLGQCHSDGPQVDTDIKDDFQQDSYCSENLKAQYRTKHPNSTHGRNDIEASGYNLPLLNCTRERNDIEALGIYLANRIASRVRLIGCAVGTVNSEDAQNASADVLQENHLMYAKAEQRRQMLSKSSARADGKKCAGSSLSTLPFSTGTTCIQSRDNTSTPNPLNSHITHSISLPSGSRKKKIKKSNRKISIHHHKMPSELPTLFESECAQTIVQDILLEILQTTCDITEEDMHEQYSLTYELEASSQKQKFSNNRLYEKNGCWGIVNVSGISLLDRKIQRRSFSGTLAVVPEEDLHIDHRRNCVNGSDETNNTIYASERINNTFKISKPIPVVGDDKHSHYDQVSLDKFEKETTILLTKSLSCSDFYDQQITAHDLQKMLFVHKQLESRSYTVVNASNVDFRKTGLKCKANIRHSERHVTNQRSLHLCPSHDQKHGNAEVLNNMLTLCPKSAFEAGAMFLEQNTEDLEQYVLRSKREVTASMLYNSTLSEVKNKISAASNTRERKRVEEHCLHSRKEPKYVEEHDFHSIRELKRAEEHDLQSSKTVLSRRGDGLSHFNSSVHSDKQSSFCCISDVHLSDLSVNVYSKSTNSLLSNQNRSKIVPKKSAGTKKVCQERVPSILSQNLLGKSLPPKDVVPKFRLSSDSDLSDDTSVTIKEIGVNETQCMTSSSTLTSDHMHKARSSCDTDSISSSEYLSCNVYSSQSVFHSALPSSAFDVHASSSDDWTKEVKAERLKRERSEMEDFLFLEQSIYEEEIQGHHLQEETNDINGSRIEPKVIGDTFVENNELGETQYKQGAYNTGKYPTDENKDLAAEFYSFDDSALTELMCKKASPVQNNTWSVEQPLFKNTYTDLLKNNLLADECTPSGSKKSSGDRNEPNLSQVKKNLAKFGGQCSDYDGYNISDSLQPTNMHIYPLLERRRNSKQMESHVYEIATDCCVDPENLIDCDTSLGSGHLHNNRSFKNYSSAINSVESVDVPSVCSKKYLRKSLYVPTVHSKSYLPAIKYRADPYPRCFKAANTDAIVCISSAARSCARHGTYATNGCRSGARRAPKSQVPWHCRQDKGKTMEDKPSGPVLPAPPTMVRASRAYTLLAKFTNKVLPFKATFLRCQQKQASSSRACVDLLQSVSLMPGYALTTHPVADRRHFSLRSWKDSNTNVLTLQHFHPACLSLSDEKEHKMADVLSERRPLSKIATDAEWNVNNEEKARPIKSKKGRCLGSTHKLPRYKLE